MDTIIISITDACPLNCLGCYATKDAPHMSLDDFKKIIDKIPLTQSITLTGGEPFVNPYLKEMVIYCAENRRKPRIVTSGFIEYDLSGISNYVELITVSLKYPDATDKTWKRREDTFEKAKNFLELAHKLNIPLAVNWVADRFNWQFLYKMVEFVSTFQAVLEVVRFIPYREELKSFALRTDVWEKVCQHALKFQNVHIGFPSVYAEAVKSGYVYCVGGVNRIYIRPDGSITPCIYLNDEIGNIFKDEWLDIEKKASDWRVLHRSYKGRTTKGCIALLKEFDLSYKQEKYDKWNEIYGRGVKN